MDTVIESVLLELKRLIEKTLNITLGITETTKINILDRDWYTYQRQIRSCNDTFMLDFLYLAKCRIKLNEMWSHIQSHVDVGDVLINTNKKHIISASDPNYLQKIKEAWTQ